MMIVFRNGRFSEEVCHEAVCRDKLPDLFPNSFKTAFKFPPNRNYFPENPGFDLNGFIFQLL